MRKAERRMICKFLFSWPFNDLEMSRRGVLGKVTCGDGFPRNNCYKLGRRRCCVVLCVQSNIAMCLRVVSGIKLKCINADSSDTLICRKTVLAHLQFFEHIR